MDNASGSDTTFKVYAVCAKAPLTYTIVSNSEPMPHGFQQAAVVTCPAGTKVLGGGGYGSSTGLNENLNSSFPLKEKKLYSWRIDVNNAESFDAFATSYAVCGTAKAYTLSVGLPSTLLPNTQSSNGRTCIAPQVPIGGGVFTDTGQLTANINSAYPTSNGWINYVNNAGPTPATITPYLICAGT